MKMPEPRRIVQGFGMEAEYLYTQEQMREALASRDAVLRMAQSALEEACGDRCNAEYNPCYAREAIKAIQEVLG